MRDVATLLCAGHLLPCVFRRKTDTSLQEAEEEVRRLRNMNERLEADPVESSAAYGPALPRRPPPLPLPPPGPEPQVLSPPPDPIGINPLCACFAQACAARPQNLAMLVFRLCVVGLGACDMAET
jgi:hypothetical protein